MVFNELHDKSVDDVISYCFVPISVMIYVVPTNKPPVIDTIPFIEPPVSSILLSKASCNPAVFAMVEPLSCMVSCFPCIVSSTSPISGNVMFVFTSNEPLMIRLLDISPPLFNKYL